MPVHVKPVAFAISKTTVKAVVLVNAIFPLPNAIDRVFVLFETNAPVLRVNPARFIAPDVRVKVLVIPSVKASASVTVIPTPLTVTSANVLPALVMVPVANNVVVPV